MRHRQEMWILARKPLSEGTVVENTLQWGVGGLNINECRIGWPGGKVPRIGTPGWGGPQKKLSVAPDGKGNTVDRTGPNGGGRWPSNLVLTHSHECQHVGIKKIRGILCGPQAITNRKVYNHGPHTPFNYASEDGTETVDAWECTEDCPIRILDEQSGERRTTYVASHHANNRTGEFLGPLGHPGSQGYDDDGGASRFFPNFAWDDVLDRMPNMTRPNQEMWILGRKPLSEPTVTLNVLRWSVGAIHVDACRIGSDPVTINRFTDGAKYWGGGVDHPYETSISHGRWPSNLVLTHAEGCRCVGIRKVRGSDPRRADGTVNGSWGTHGIYGGASSTGMDKPCYVDEDGMEAMEVWECVPGCPVAELDAQSGNRPGCKNPSNATCPSVYRPDQGNYQGQGPIYGDSGSASRFFPNFAYDPNLDGSLLCTVDNVTETKMTTFEDVLNGRAKWAVIRADALEAAQSLPENSLDGAILDPPAGISFMGREWDKNKGGRDQWIEWLKVRLQALYVALKPGAHILVWGIPKTYHWTALAVEDAGFELREVILHLFGSGFPKSLNISKALAKRAGGPERAREAIAFMKSTREGLGLSRNELENLIFGRCDGNVRNWEDGISIPVPGLWPRIKTALGLDKTPFDEDMERGDQEVGIKDGDFGYQSDGLRWNKDYVLREPVTSLAERWEGWGTALKPSQEMWALARKPLSESTVALNILKWGVGAINIDGTRVPHASAKDLEEHQKMVQAIKARGGSMENSWKNSSDLSNASDVNPGGRWPSNLVLTHTPNCKMVGIRKIKANQEGAGKLWSHYRDGTEDRAKATPSKVGDEDGMETVEAWECVDGCPVKALDEQSGQLRARGNINSTKGGNTGFLGYGTSYGEPDSGDTGGASRFFPNFAYEPDLDFPLFLYTPKPSKSEKNKGCEELIPDSTRVYGDAYDKNMACHACGRILKFTHQGPCPRCGSNDIGKAQYFANTRVKLRDDLSEEQQNSLLETLSQQGVCSEDDDSFVKNDIPEELQEFFVPIGGRGKTAGNTHPTVKPTALLRWFIKLIIPPNGIVADFFCGSGTTGVAARLEGMRFLGCDTDDEVGSTEIARARIRAAEGYVPPPKVTPTVPPPENKEPKTVNLEDLFNL